jgi:hypothetical protein
MKKNLKYVTIALLTSAAITGCKKDEDDDPIMRPVNEEEVITTVQLHFRSVHDVEHKHFEFNDPDGDGGGAPVITADTLSADSVYTVEILVLNESSDPVGNITEEIEEEGDEHQFFFQFTGANASAAYNDTDVNSLPVGLSTTWTIGAPSNGTVVVTLRHEPDKTAAGVSEGDITNAGGETDIEVTFPMVIE